MLTLSVPVELLFFLCFIASWTCIVVSIILVVYSLCVFLSLCCVLENYLLNAFAICVGKVNVFFLKGIVLFVGCSVFLLANPCMVFQSVYVLCL